MSESEHSTRRRFLSNIGAVAGAGLILSPTQAVAQTANSGNVRVYRSGETIEDKVAKVVVDGWGITYDWNETLEYLRKTGREVDVVLRGGRVVPVLGDFFEGHTTYIDGKQLRTHRSLPTTIDERAYVHVFERESGKGDYFDPAQRRIVAERVYPVALDFHTSGDPFRRVLGGQTPNVNQIGVFSEVQLEQGLLGKVLELHSLFWQLGFTPPIYIENVRGEDVKPSSSEEAIRIPAVDLANMYKDKGFAKLYAELVRQLPDSEWFGKGPNPKEVARLSDVHATLMQSAGFDRDKYEGWRSAIGTMNEKDWRDYREKIASTPSVKIFDLDSYVKGDIDFRVDARYHPNPMYFTGKGIFASVMAVFRYYPEEFLDIFEKLNQTEKRSAANVGNTVLDYLSSYAREGVKEQLNLPRVLPAYHILKSEFARHL